MKRIFLLLLLMTALFIPMLAKAEDASQTNKVSTAQPQIIVPTSSSRTSSYVVDAIDPLITKSGVSIQFPGARGANQLIIYTPKFGLKTGTNEYGKEAIVVNGRVVKLSPNDSFIPTNGYVISGHGTAKNWIENNITVGARINVDVENNMITSYIESDSYIYEAENNYATINLVIDSIKRSNVNYDSLRSDKFMSKAKEYMMRSRELQKIDPEKSKLYAKEAILYANNALVYAIPPKQNEFKGIWIRPTETTIEQIGMSLDRIKSAGINNVFVETYYHGMTIYPSNVMAKYNLRRVNPIFACVNDELDLWIKEAHKRNMKVHAWFQTFYIGNAPINSSSKHMLAMYPQWANVQKQNVLSSEIIPCSSEHAGFFLDPANPDVQTFLLALVSEVVTNYDIDGINLDYIRYPRSSPSNYFGYVQTNWGYSTYARGEFKKLYAIDPVDLDTSMPMWNRWVDYRQSKITDFVIKARQVKTTKPNILLTAVIFPDRDQAETEKLQRWSLWANNGYFDAFTPLIMSSSEELTKAYISNIQNCTRNRTKIFPGIFQPFSNSSYVDMLTQIKTIRDANADGIVLFDYAHLQPFYAKALKARAFSECY